jgi:hypothetical protein
VKSFATTRKTSGAPRVPTVRRSAVQIKQMPISVTISGPKIAGLELMSPAAPEFYAAVRSLFTGSSDELLKLKPFLTILSNRCDRTLVAYALKWEVALHDERRITMSQHKYPDAVAPGAPRRGNEIRPGEQKIVAMSIEIDCGRWGGEATEEFYLRQFIDWFTEYNEANALEISIDAAIFDDGEFKGPNKSDLDQDFRSYVRREAGLLQDDRTGPRFRHVSGRSPRACRSRCKGQCRQSKIGFERRAQNVAKDRRP